MVCHMSESILWLISQAYWPTAECQVFQFVPSTNISRQFVSKLLTLLQLIRVLPAWIDDHPNNDSKLCKVACLPVHSIAQRIFWACPSMSQDHATVFACGFSQPGNFSVAPAEIRDSNTFVCCSTSLHSRWVHPKYTWSRTVVDSWRSTFFINFFHMGALFCFFPVILMSSTKTDRNNTCFRWTNMHSPIWYFLPSKSFFELSFP